MSCELRTEPLDDLLSVDVREDARLADLLVCAALKLRPLGQAVGLRIAQPRDRRGQLLARVGGHDQPRRQHQPTEIGNAVRLEPLDRFARLQHLHGRFDQAAHQVAIARMKHRQARGHAVIVDGRNAHGRAAELFELCHQRRADREIGRQHQAVAQWDGGLVGRRLLARGTHQPHHFQNALDVLARLIDLGISHHFGRHQAGKAHQRHVLAHLGQTCLGFVAHHGYRRSVGHDFLVGRCCTRRIVLMRLQVEATLEVSLDGRGGVLGGGHPQHQQPEYSGAQNRSGERAVHGRPPGGFTACEQAARARLRIETMTWGATSRGSAACNQRAQPPPGTRPAARHSAPLPNRVFAATAAILARSKILAIDVHASHR